MGESCMSDEEMKEERFASFIKCKLLTDKQELI